MIDLLKHIRLFRILALLLLFPAFGSGCAALSPPIPAPAAATPPSLGADLDTALRVRLQALDVGPLDPGPPQDAAKVALGQALFFDKELSGNRDISCATCHHPAFAGGDGLALSVGTGGLGLGPERLRGAMRPLIPRNAPELFNRGSPEWRTMFWDSRVAGSPDTGFSHPAEFETPLPPGLDSVLAAQALFPLASGAEMKGERGDVDVFGQDNLLGDIDDDNLAAAWDGVMARLLAIPAYRTLFAAAYPDVPPEALDITHAANAIAAFEIDAFTLLNSPWDRYLRGEYDALSPEQKRGALLFFGKAGCVNCHSGSLFTDQQHHNLAAPQIGPGKGREAPHTDLGRYRETGDPADRFAFRTPPLRNVTLTGPYFHNGSYVNLKEVVRHHLAPATALRDYDLDQLSPDVLAETQWRDDTIEAMLAALDPVLLSPPALSVAELDAILAFLSALTDPAASDLTSLIPASSPSGLPVADGPTGLTPFKNVTAMAGIRAVHNGGYQVTGQAWGDYDNDGWLDLYVTDGGGPNLLYHNNGDGTFALASQAEQVALPEHDSSGALFGDYDNDGWADLYVLGRGANVLFHNDGGRGFSDVTEIAGVGDSNSGKTAAWGDFDGDGYLDLYVANWACSPRCARPIEGERDTLYHNNGDGTFDDVTALLGPHTRGAGFVATFTDFDNDGDPDIYLVNDEFINPVGNKLWRNDGPGCDGWCFSQVAAEAGADTHVMGMGLAADDFNQDGLIDFYFSNAGEMTLLQNLGDGTFSDAAARAGVALDRSAIGWGAVSIDYDNDGWRDLYQALMERDTMVSPYNPLFHNNGDGTFSDVGISSGAADPGPSLGVAYADYDNDGWVDLVVGNYHRSYELYHNESKGRSPHRWLTLKLVGGGPVNRDAVGARVWVTTSDGRTQMQEVRSGASMGSGNALPLYFGLGSNDVQDVLVRWPNGAVHHLGALAAGRIWEARYQDTEHAVTTEWSG